MKKLIATLTTAVGLAAGASTPVINLSNVTADTYLGLSNETVIVTGVLGESHKISIFDGATVILSNATINANGALSGEYAGITCLGNATIILADGSANTVKAFGNNSPGIFVPSNSANPTLTIHGSGSLTASCSNGGFGAGIGGGWSIPCGNIVIAGGMITAMGGSSAAGIGGGFGACGDISILGGTVAATGGERAAGIGGGYRASCGNITIGADITCIVAISGGGPSGVEFDTAIGAGFEGSGGTLAPISPELIDTTSGATRTIMRWDGNLSTLTTDVTVFDGMVLTGELRETVKVSIAAGATVTLSNAAINRTGEYFDSPGLRCLGDATILLDGANNISGFDGNRSGILVPDSYRLVISNLNANASLDILRTDLGGAGIGGGYDESCGDIDIYGGVITVVGGYYSAGIGGGGQDTSCGTIRIMGGTINATGGFRAAGIGSSMGGSCTGVAIEGGTVSATGGGYGAGIGAGNSNGSGHPASCGNIALTGGDVTATGGDSAAGIGGGYAGFCGDIFIGAGISQVVATCGDRCTNPIGLGYDPPPLVSCTVNVATNMIDYTDGSTRTITHPPVIGGYAWNYTVVNGEAKIIPWGDITNMIPAVVPAPSGALEIPAVLGGYPVTSIGSRAFSYCADITSVTIPGSVTNIEDLAFYGCGSLATVTIPASVTGIGDWAFGDTALGTVYVGTGRTAAVQEMLLASQHGQSFVDAITFIEPWDGNLSTLTGDVVIWSDTTIYGELGDLYQISVADGVSVTLSNATIQVSGANSSSYSWAGLTCIGDAEIILAEGTSNEICGFYDEYPGIYVPTNRTLIISGTGSLTAYSNGYGAGIGGGYKLSCGNIWIKGGNISAEGGAWNAGIGGGGSNSNGGTRPSCGNIMIDGGTVVAKGGPGGAGIGGGKYGVCGDITIGTGITRVSATRGSSEANPIGAGGDGSGGTLAPLPAGLLDTTLPNGSTRTIYREVDSWDGNLSTLTGNAVIRSDMTIYGTLGGFYCISVADGVSVTLSNATIQVSNANFVDYSWAGITCLGDAEIILAEGTTNNLRGFYEDYPGIYIPTNKTLTISGSGSLDASSNGYGAGIGGGYQLPCGDIVIAGGTITATGGNWAAGFGAGRYRACGAITITGGSVTATGGSYAAGIGSGYSGSSGAIALTGGSITATGGRYAAGIGSGLEGSTGTITIGAGITRIVATRGEDFENDPIYDGTDAFSSVSAGLTDTLSADGSTRTIVPEAGSISYAAWAARAGLGEWNATDANGIHNVFRYAFNKLPMFYSNFTLIDITFNDQGQAVVVTPPLVNSAGFTFTVVASDAPDGTGSTASYPLNATGETVINETGKTTRFFHLRVVEAE